MVDRNLECCLFLNADSSWCLCAVPMSLPSSVIVTGRRGEGSPATVTPSSHAGCPWRSLHFLLVCQGRVPPWRGSVLLGWGQPFGCFLSVTHGRVHSWPLRVFLLWRQNVKNPRRSWDQGSITCCSLLTRASRSGRRARTSGHGDRGWSNHASAGLLVRTACWELLS